MNEEISKILKMVEEGKIDSEKAMALIEALKVETKEFVTLDKTVPNNNTESNNKIKGKTLKIKIKSKDNDIVNINLPMNFFSGIMKTFGRIPNLNGMGDENTDTMSKTVVESVDVGTDGKIVDIKSGDGDVVEVLIE
jgi:hypothetical protein